AGAPVGADALRAGALARAPPAQRQGDGALERRAAGDDPVGPQGPGRGQAVSEHRREMGELLSRARWLPRGRAQADLVEQAVRLMRRDTAVMMGDREAADRAHAQLARVRRDSLSNCQACVADAAVEYLVLRGEDEAAVKNAEVVFSGRLRCAEVPQRTYAL